MNRFDWCIYPCNNANNCWHSNINEKDQFHAQFMRLVEHEKSFITSRSADLSLGGTYNLLFISSASLALIIDKGNNIENTQPLKKTTDK